MSDNVIEFRRPELHASGEAICQCCKHTWVAVVPMSNIEGDDGWLECPACGTHKGRLKYAFRPPVGSMVFTCNCGGELFYWLDTGLLCPNCGSRPAP